MGYKIDKNTITTKLQNKINSSTADEGYKNSTLLSVSADNVTDNRDLSVSIRTLVGLNTCLIPDGQIVYLEDINLPLVHNACKWYGFDGREFSIECGSYTGERTLWSWGNNSIGRIGDGTTTTTNAPVQEFCSDITWCQVSAGCAHTSAVKTGGTLWSWGCGAFGRLGDGTNANKCSPVQEICSDTTWCQTSAGEFHTSALKTGGTLWAWGNGTSAQIGDGNNTDKCSPVQEFCSDTTWCQVSTGAFHASALKTGGTLWSWGTGICGRLGDGTTTSKCSPTQEICSDTTWCQVSSGCLHTSAVKTGGTLWAWGSNFDGQLGDGTVGSLASKCSPVQEFCSDTTWCQVSAGGVHSAAVKTGGTLWAWGCQRCGRLGDGFASFGDTCSPVQEFYSDTMWTQVSAGGGTTSSNTSALKADGTLWAWGAGGRTGDGTNSTRCSPVQEVTCSVSWVSLSTSSFHTVASKLSFIISE